MSVIKMGRLGFGALLMTLLLVIVTAEYHSRKVIDGLERNCDGARTGANGIQEIDRSLTLSGFALLRFINRDKLQATDIATAFDRIVAGEEGFDRKNTD